MKKSKKMLMEMANVALPYVRKTLTPEAASPFHTVKSDQVRTGTTIQFPDKKGKQFVVVHRAAFGEGVYVVEVKGMVVAITKDELVGATAKEYGATSKQVT